MNAGILRESASYVLTLLSMVDDYENVPHTPSEREMLGMRFEEGTYAFQQLLSLSVHQNDSESEAFLYELFRNYQLLHIELNRPEYRSHCINLTVCALKSPHLSANDIHVTSSLSKIRHCQSF